MEYRVDLYAAGGVYRDTVGFVARNEVEAVVTARGLVVEQGLARARVWQRHGAGQLQHIEWVGAER
ncbi:hypothetical protein OG992_18565 [Micromonospora sp. NBC_00362]|uniref:hypothetical protein n=1 Tax=Micromonospora sp. NBC_00362 TaxID=2975975 RepID=UPI00225C1AAD|nr:hypothetical protein [Micromonospora sp. NBC_00362]MCX5119192.1 hypothetical protein [Micromonospora sp. NBC_00362]